MIKLIGFSVKHSISVLSITLALVICCFAGIFSISYDYLPKLQDRYLLISSVYEGLSAEEMKILVTHQIEDSVTSLKGMKNVSSVTRDSLSLVTVELHWNTNVNVALTDCKGIIDECYESLPSQCSKPEVTIFNPNDNPSITIAVRPLDSDLKYGRYIVDKEIKSHLQRIKGVASVTSSGGEKEEIHVVLNKDKTLGTHLSLNDISSILSEANFEYPAGTIKEGNKEFLFKTSALFSQKEDIACQPLTYTNEGLIRLSDIGSVEYGTADKDSFFFLGQNECICLNVFKKIDASPIELSKECKKEIQILNDLYGSFYEFSIIYDQSEELVSSIVSLALSALIGIAVTVALLFLFFRSARMALLVSSIIPLSILFSLLMLSICHCSVNVMSLSGIAVGIGMVIDPTIVAVEAIAKRLKKGECLDEAITDGVDSVSFSNIGSTLTTAVVFLPLFFISGLMGMLFKDMAIAITSSIVFSCVLSLTFVPAIFSLAYRKRPYNSSKELSFEKAEKVYKKVITKSFDIKWLTPVVIGASLVLTVAIGFILPKEILPSTYSKVIYLDFSFPESASLSSLEKEAAVISEKLDEIQSIDSFYVSGGIEKDDYVTYSNLSAKKENLHFTCICKDSRRAKKALERIFEGTSYKYRIEGSKNILSSILSIEKDSYIVTSESAETVLEKAKEYADDEHIYPFSFVDEYVFKPDREASSRFSISSLNSATEARNALNGVYSTVLYKEGKEIPVLVRFPEKTFTSKEQMGEVSVLCGDKYVPLKVLGSIDTEKKEKVFYRYSKKDAKKITADKKVAEKSAKGDLISLNKKEMNELFGNAAVLLVVILLLLYCIMGAQFQSFKIPILIAVSIASAFAGSFIFLLVFGRSININSIVALIVLFGTSVNNAILLYESVRSCDVIDKDSVIDSCVAKLRSILITTLSSIIALVPFAIDPLRKNAQSSMAIAIIGGLIFSLFVVLLIMPKILYREGKKA